jgi:hypothetical protein
MTTTFEDAPLSTVPLERLQRLLDQVRANPQFGPMVTDEYRSGYSAAKIDVEPLVDVEVTSMLGIYEVLDVASALFKPSQLGVFLTRSVSALNDHSPMDLLMAGEAQRVLELIAAEYEGQAG